MRIQLSYTCQIIGKKGRAHSRQDLEVSPNDCRVRSSFSSLLSYTNESSRNSQRGMIVTLTVVMLMSIGLFLLLGPFEMAKATWLLSHGESR